MASECTGPRAVAHPDRLLPIDAATRALARELYDATAALPVVSAHNHLDPKMLLENRAFADATDFFVTGDHYVTRLLHAHGIPMTADHRQTWRALCEHWPAFAGTPTRYWIESQLHELFGIDAALTVDNADSVFESVSDLLQDPSMRPRELLHRCRVETVATTDDPCSDLSAHVALATDPTFRPNILPTFRPDAYLDVSSDAWPDSVRRLATTVDRDIASYGDFTQALEARRTLFIAHGATATDHGPADAQTVDIDPAERERIFGAALRGAATPDERVMLRRHLTMEMARMSADDGLVMQLHPGVLRNHHTPTWRQHGPDTGHDIPVAAEFTHALRPLLERFGTAQRFRLVLYTVDESTWSRELAPLAGFYPSVFLGVPWWFLDAPAAIHRFRAAVTETAGLLKTAGFVDDTRAVGSLGARHDMARRVDAGYLAELVGRHVLDAAEARTLAVELAYALPTRVFRLPPANMQKSAAGGR